MEKGRVYVISSYTMSDGGNRHFGKGTEIEFVEYSDKDKARAKFTVPNSWNSRPFTISVAKVEPKMPSLEEIAENKELELEIFSWVEKFGSKGKGTVAFFAREITEVKGEKSATEYARQLYVQLMVQDPESTRRTLGEELSEELIKLFEQ